MKLLVTFLVGIRLAAQVACTVVPGSVSGTAGLTALTWDNGGGPVSYFDGGVTPFRPTLNFVQSVNGGTHTPQSGTVTSFSVTGNVITQNFAWGSIVTTYGCPGTLVNSIDITHVVTNSLTDPIDELYINSMGVAFANAPTLPTNQVLWNIDSPTSIDYVDSVAGVSMVAVNKEVTKPLGVGFKLIAAGNLRWNVIAEIDSRNLTSANWIPANQPVPANGGTVTFTTSVRFASATANEANISADIFAAFAAAYPYTFVDPCKGRPIAGFHLASNLRPFLALNPRGFRGETSNPADYDMSTGAGIDAWQGAETHLVTTNVIPSLAATNSCGVIIWDAEGAETDQTYIGSPDLITTIAPEWARNNYLSTFVNLFITAGYRVGFTLRPQTYTSATCIVNVSGTAVTWVSDGGNCAAFDPNWALCLNNVPSSLYSCSVAIESPVLNTSNIASVTDGTHLTLATSRGTSCQAGTSTCTMLYSQMKNDPPNVQTGIIQPKIAFVQSNFSAIGYDYYIDTYGSGQSPKTVNDIYGAAGTCATAALFPTAVLHIEQSAVRDWACSSPYREANATPSVTEPDVETLAVYPNKAHGMVNVTDTKATANPGSFYESVLHGNLYEWQVTQGSSQALAVPVYRNIVRPPSVLVK